MEKIKPATRAKRIPRAKSNLERALWLKGAHVCGIDEVGRGCLAGPVVTSAVILYSGKVFPLLKDSKILTKEERVRAARWIKQHSWYAYGVVSHYEVDQHNIYQATLQAMNRAVMHLFSKVDCLPQKILIDAMPLKLSAQAYQGVKVDHFPFGEQKSVSIAAASILAKVYRDELMDTYNRLIPGYALGRHKGYATKGHRSALGSEGVSILHRRTFLGKIQERQEQYEEQVSLLCGSNREFPVVDQG